MLKQVHQKLQALRKECENDEECNHKCYSGRIKNKDLASLNKKLGQFEENFDVKSRITHLNLIPIRLNVFIATLKELNSSSELDEQILFFNLAIEQETQATSSDIDASNNEDTHQAAQK